MRRRIVLALCLAAAGFALAGCPAETLPASAVRSINDMNGSWKVSGDHGFFFCVTFDGPQVVETLDKCENSVTLADVEPVFISGDTYQFSYSFAMFELSPLWIRMAVRVSPVGDGTLRGTARATGFGTGYSESWTITMSR